MILSKAYITAVTCYLFDDDRRYRHLLYTLHKGSSVPDMSSAAGARDHP